MDPVEAPNPERRSDPALICLIAGAALVALAWVFGFGAMIATLLTGASAPALAGGIAALILAPVMGVGGAILIVVATIWIIVRVIADSREANSKERYRDVQR
jgi:hypothetical protein